MQLRPLYRVRITTIASWSVSLTGANGTESQHLQFNEGYCKGRIAGRFRNANHPRRRTDETYLPDAHGVIETDDGATILVDFQGFGRAYPIGRRQVVMAVIHLSEDERYRWLNDALCVAVGEARTDPNEFVFDIAELVWEPIAE